MLWFLIDELIEVPVYNECAEFDWPSLIQQLQPYNNLTVVE
jgi:hypothetical protein